MDSPRYYSVDNDFKLFTLEIHLGNPPNLLKVPSEFSSNLSSSLTSCHQALTHIHTHKHTRKYTHTHTHTIGGFSYSLEHKASFTPLFPTFSSLDPRCPCPMPYAHYEHLPTPRDRKKYQPL